MPVFSRTQRIQFIPLNLCSMKPSDKLDGVRSLVVVVVVVVVVKLLDEKSREKS